MIERLSDKKKACTYCTKYGHTQWRCPAKPRKPLQSRNQLKTTKPLNKRGPVAKRWTSTRKEFMKSLGNATLLCHYCLKPVPANEAEVDHMESRSRRPDLRFAKANLVISCHACNSLKGSKSHDEFSHKCSV